MTSAVSEPLTPNLIQQIKEYGRLQFSLDDTLLALNLDETDEATKIKIERYLRQGIIEGVLHNHADFAGIDPTVCTPNGGHKGAMPVGRFNRALNLGQIVRDQGQETGCGDAQYHELCSGQNGSVRSSEISKQC